MFIFCVTSMGVNPVSFADTIMSTQYIDTVQHPCAIAFGVAWA